MGEDGDRLSTTEDPGARRRPDDSDARTRSRLVGAYGPVRTYFRVRPDRYRSLQRRLDQGRFGTTFDAYLATSARSSAIVAAGVALLSALALAGLELVGGVGGVTRSPAATMPRPLLSLPALVVGVGLVGGASAWLWLVHYVPRRAVTRRRRAIDRTMPSAITFLYALTDGGTDVLEAIRALGDEPVYGDTATEFDAIVREMDLFGNDLHTAIDNTRDLTPSESLTQFLDGLLGVLESGGDVSDFLDAEVDKQVELALESQERFVDRLGLLGELFVASFVAGPLFLIVTLLVIGVVGGDVLLELGLVVYVVLPLGAALFFLFVDLLVGPARTATTSPSHGWDRPREPDDLEDPSRLQAYRQHKRRTRLLEPVTTVATAVRERPVRGFALTVPVALATVAGLVLGGVVEPTVEAVLERPVRTTAALAVGPGLLATLPVAAVYERGRRRERELVDRVPDVLDLLANANRMGVALTDGLRLVSTSITGPLGTELAAAKNDVRWNHDPAAAFRRLAGRLPVPRIAPTLTIVAEGSRVSTDLEEVLEIAAEELRIQARLESARRREVGPYLAIVFVGSLVYLLVIVVLTASFLDPIGEAATPDVGAVAGAPTQLAVDVEAYRVLFYHSALIQGATAGLLGGKLAEGHLLGGLKYAIALVVIVTAAFFLV